MTVERTEIDKNGLELYELAEAYARKADLLAADPYFRDAVMRVSVSSFVWALYHANSSDERSLAVLSDELKVQCEAVERSVQATINQEG